MDNGFNHILIKQGNGQERKDLPIGSRPEFNVFFISNDSISTIRYCPFFPVRKKNLHLPNVFLGKCLYYLYEYLRSRYEKSNIGPSIT